MSLRIRSRVLLCYPLLLALLCGPSLSMLAARPTAPRLLPQNTLLYVRVNNVLELIDRFQETSIGQIAQDPKITVSLKSDEKSRMQLITEVHTQLRNAQALKLNYSTLTKQSNL